MVKKKVTITKITKTCAACPAQWEAKTDDGMVVYIRYRWGGLSICIGDTIDNAVMGKEIMHTSYGNGLDGTMDYETLKEIAKKYIVFPESEESNSARE